MGGSLNVSARVDTYSILPSSGEDYILPTANTRPDCHLLPLQLVQSYVGSPVIDLRVRELNIHIVNILLSRIRSGILLAT